MSDVLELARPTYQHGRNFTVQELLDMALPMLEERFADNPEIRSRVLYSIGTAYESTAVHNTGKDLIRESLRIRRQLKLPKDVVLIKCLIVLRGGDDGH